MHRDLTAVYFTWKRELIRFFRARSRIIGSLGMPFFFLAVLGSGLNGAITLPGSSGNYMQFIFPGILGMVLMSGSISSGIMVIFDRQFGFLKETLVAPVSRPSIIFGKSLGGSTTALIQGMLMLVIATFLGVSINLAVVPAAVLLMVLIAMGFVSLGLVIASLVEDMHGFQLIMNFLVFPMFFLSGALFPLDNAPQIVRMISYIDPLTYGVEALRFLFLGSSSIPIAVSAGVLSVFMVGGTLLAAYLFNKIES